MARATGYTAKAKAYWETYLPSQVAQMKNSHQFFKDLGQQVADQVEALTSTATDAALAQLPENPSYEKVLAARQGAALQAEESVLADLAFLPPEPGTQDKRLPGTVLAGWEDQPTAMSASLPPACDLI